VKVRVPLSGRLEPSTGVLAWAHSTDPVDDRSPP
jgi:hypothetical protein